MRDYADNVIIITSMENVDPMGVHNGDSVVIAHSQTLTYEEYNTFVDLCKRIIRKIGITGGGVNIQFAQNPDVFLNPLSMTVFLRSVDSPLKNFPVQRG